MIRRIDLDQLPVEKGFRMRGVEMTRLETFTVASLALVFVILLYIYPLRLMSAALASFATGGLLPSEFQIEKVTELTGLFVIYGVGFTAMSAVLILLYMHALGSREGLELDEYETLRTRQDLVNWLILGATGMVSALWAAFLPPQWGIWAGMIYPTLCVTTPYLAIRHKKEAEALAQR